LYDRHYNKLDTFSNLRVDSLSVLKKASDDVEKSALTN